MIHKIFRKIEILQFINKIVQYGLGLVDTWLIYEILSKAMKKEINNTIKYSVLFVLVLIIQMVICFLLEKVCYKNKKYSLQEFREKLCNTILKKKAIGNTAQMRTRLSKDSIVIASYFSEMLPNFFSGSIIIITATLIIGYINWKIALIFFIGSWFQIIPILCDKRWASDNISQTRKIEEEIDDFYLEIYEGFSTVKSYGIEEYVLNKLKSFHNHFLKLGNGAEYNGSIIKILMNTSKSILNYGSYLLVGYFAWNKQIEIFMIPVIIKISGFLFNEASNIIESFFDYYNYNVSKQRLEDFYPTLENNCDKKYNLKNIQRIKLDNLSFSYENKSIFKNINLDIEEGKHIVIVGKNGSGKSTLSKLLLGNCDTYDGNIFIDTKEMKELSDEEHAKLISFLPQEETTFHMTAEELAECIEIEQLGVKKDIKKTASLFGINDVLWKDKRLEELSGGQRKKVFLSIALLRKSKFAILDEPTNSLDEESCEVLLQMLKETKKTLIIISHDQKILELFGNRFSLS